MKCSYHSDRDAIAGCVNCGNLICEGCAVEVDGKKICKECISSGRINTQLGSNIAQQNKEKSKVVAALLAFFVGAFGIHRFYLGETGGVAITQLILGVCGIFTCGLTLIVSEIWALVDFIMILTGNLKSSDGKPLS